MCACVCVCVCARVGVRHSACVILWKHRELILFTFLEIIIPNFLMINTAYVVYCKHIASLATCTDINLSRQNDWDELWSDIPRDKADSERLSSVWFYVWFYVWFSVSYKLLRYPVVFLSTFCMDSSCVFGCPLLFMSLSLAFCLIACLTVLLYGYLSISLTVCRVNILPACMISWITATTLSIPLSAQTTVSLWLLLCLVAWLFVDVMELFRCRKSITDNVIYNERR